MKVLIVDDERGARKSLAQIVNALPDVEIREAGSLAEARAALEADDPDVALLDVRLGPDARNRDGLTLVEEVRARFRAVPIIVSGSSEMDEVRTAMRMGAHDYVLKDELSEELVVPLLLKIADKLRMENELIALRARARGCDGGLGLVGTSRAMQRLRESIKQVALSDRPVLVSGPTGAGKELVVRAIHALGAHPQEPLLDLNCGAFPEALIESQLFGHERGAFTGADRKQEGFFSAVGQGTLFLDEIAELPMELQAKLLRVLESGTFRAVGSAEAKKFKGRVVAATHANLEERVAEGRFREDLFYRLNVLELIVPSLDERREDIPALALHFAASQPRPLQFTAEAMHELEGRPWPGNVRQLRNVVDRLAVFAGETPVTAEAVARIGRPRDLAVGGGRSAIDRMGPVGAKNPQPARELARSVLRGTERDKLQWLESLLVEEALRMADGNKTEAARLLGVHRKVVERRADRPVVVAAVGDAEE
jgi:DNA-binding NtrC family response regulator